MLNINYEHNKSLLDSCQPLKEYAWFVARVRENNKPKEDGTRIGIEQALDQAIDEMPQEFLIKKFMQANRAEVKEMCLTEYNEAEVLELTKEEGREEGEDLLGKIIAKLLGLGRIEDARKAAVHKDFGNRMYKEFNISL